MASITTSIPTGIISSGPAWCIMDIFGWGPDHPPYKYKECANATDAENPTQPQDFLTICCDGKIIDTSQDMYKAHLRNNGHFLYPLELDNLVCCREAGVRQMGGIGPFPNPTRCDAVLTPTPLVSLAATNTKNAAPYLATYESGKWDNEISDNVDWIRTETPQCLWVQTTHPEVTLVEVQVPAAEITTLPIAVTDAWGDTVGYIDADGNTSLLTTSTTSARSSPTRARTSATPTPTSAGRKGAELTVSAILCLGLLTALFVG
ncbi:hypothetical protein QBC34DRAFT_403900 [Podospora aff. communis PSN243]|uniref:Uncharacterized protein n=1 Tax=Podospora aff. communis PSN243 TaxID=3040156 RepID=A0AAV9GNY6_9PEZI|nr:hypothetical protein QBC34DRAFT_403900 [Podospora aff. communis PSN243]